MLARTASPAREAMPARTARAANQVVMARMVWMGLMVPPVLPVRMDYLATRASKDFPAAMEHLERMGRAARTGRPVLPARTGLLVRRASVGIQASRVLSQRPLRCFGCIYPGA
jgi:hypothetical protein